MVSNNLGQESPFTQIARVLNEFTLDEHFTGGDVYERLSHVRPLSVKTFVRRRIVTGDIERVSRNKFRRLKTIRLGCVPKGYVADAVFGVLVESPFPLEESLIVRRLPKGTCRESVHNVLHCWRVGGFVHKDDNGRYTLAPVSGRPPVNCKPVKRR